MAKNNRTITLSEDEQRYFSTFLRRANNTLATSQIENQIFLDSSIEVLKYFPNEIFDLIIADPPYNLNKTFNSSSFKEGSIEYYSDYLRTWLPNLVRTLKKTGTIYVCSDWKSSTSVHLVLQECGLIIQNRITWEREKGRGAKSNWKNSSEDIWFATKSKDFYFDAEKVKLKRKVLAPYRNEEGEAKDWSESEDGKYRLTSPSNLWTDLTVPFWSMIENTEHPTQKPEKGIAKLILASSKEDDLVFDPFLGSGTTAVVAKKLGRKYCGIEMDEKYACLALKRLKTAEIETKISGYQDGIFWDRNSGK